LAAPLNPVKIKVKGYIWRKNPEPKYEKLPCLYYKYF